MILANVKDLKSRLNRYLRLAEQGKVIVVLRRGKVVAEIHPARKGRRRKRGKPSLEEVMLSLAEQGQVELATQSGPVGLRPPIKVRDPEGAQEILDQLWKDRKRK